MKAKNLYAATGLSLIALFASAACLAASKAEIDAGVTTALKDWEAINPSHGELASKAAGMLVFPHITKGGVGIAGEYGEGYCESTTRQWVTTVSRPPRLE